MRSTPGCKVEDGRSPCFHTSNQNKLHTPPNHSFSELIIWLRMQRKKVDKTSESDEPLIGEKRLVVALFPGGAARGGGI